ncbi:MAG: (2Fe-2S)-binding protein [Candidatus Marinimicrobia bacterium]|nr:(2Fe-2S)-binding protein [Candidatus Neomarinimicrobiota bacterium]
MKAVLKINGTEVPVKFDFDEHLLQTLRNHGFTEVKNGCEEGECGACLVLLNGKPVNSCQVFTATAIGDEITTVKGIGTLHQPHIIQECFVEAGAVQCGFCTPGMVLATYALLQDNPDPSDDEIKRALSGNLCRCTGYVKIIDAVKRSARKMKIT